jgi:hypothetical protein
MEVSCHEGVVLAPWKSHARAVVVPRHGGVAPVLLSCCVVEVPRRGAMPSRSHAHAVVPCRGVRRVEQSHASMDGGERERAVAATLNLGEMEMNGRE